MLLLPGDWRRAEKRRARAAGKGKRKTRSDWPSQESLSTHIILGFDSRHHDGGLIQRQKALENHSIMDSDSNFGMDRCRSHRCCREENRNRVTESSGDSGEPRWVKILLSLARCFDNRATSGSKVLEINKRSAN